jgi:N-acyl-L-homoserine lactone synthetase
MVVNRSTVATELLDDSFTVETVDSSESLEDVFRLRFQVYCLERRFEPGRDGLETDHFDAISRHVLLRHRPSGRAIGTVRLIIPHLNGPASLLPMQELADLPSLPGARIAEVSGFALSKVLRPPNAAGCFARLALIRGMVRLSAQMKLTHWCALMEPKLLRLLGASGIHFRPMGGLIEHHGLRQPSFIDLTEMLERVRREKPTVWDFITGAGAPLKREDNCGQRMANRGQVPASARRYSADTRAHRSACTGG